MPASERKAFKDWFDSSAAARLAAQFQKVCPAFDSAAFQQNATRGLNALEFHGRVQRFSDALRLALPDSVPDALDLLVRGLPPALPDCEAVTDGWLQWPLGVFIADHGLPHVPESFRAMEELTQRFSSEFAVRPFLAQHPDDSFRRLRRLVQHPSPHVRRWCSEGTRPRLPWGRQIPALIRDPSPSLPLLEALRDDPELYVRRSVANHLNDIAKDHPHITLDICRRWLRDASPDRAALVRHALRTRIKAGDPDALALLGFHAAPKLRAELHLQPAAPRIGEHILLQARLHNPGRGIAVLAIDYKLHFARPGGRPSAKVFKWTTRTLQPGEECTLEKKHPLRHASIRQLHPGEHHIDLQINGQSPARASFQLRAED